MKYSEFRGVRIPQFTLGTVQLGMDYGLGEFTAKPSEDYAFEILDCAARHGVSMLDTANNYGTSETVIGRWLRSRGDTADMQVVTKIGPLDHSSSAALREDILRQTRASMENLGVSQLDVLMIHSFEDYDRDKETCREVFREMREMGWYRLSAISAYSRHDYRVLAESGFDAVQIPLNVFDWSQIENGGISAMADAGMLIFVRSVFLQGLVFMKPEELDPRMDFCAPYLKRYLALCREFGVSPAALAVSFALSVPGVRSVVLGVQRVEQLESNCELMEQLISLSPAQMDSLHAAFRGIDPRVVNPGCWFNHT